MSVINGVGLLSANIRMSRIGVWHADVEAEAEADLSGAVTFEIDGETFVGTSLPGRSGLNGSRMVARVVGGAGGLSTELPAQSYESAAGVRVSAILGHILRATGETLSETSEQAILDKRLPRWHRSAGPASRALVQLADAAGADWRVLADGTVWIGSATWPEQTVEHVLEDEDWVSGCLTIAPDKPDLRPGVTFLGVQIETVEHRVNKEGFLRTEAHVSSLRSAFSKMMGRIKRDVDYSRVYRCRVSTQNADGSLQLVPDDDKMKGRGLDKVPIWLGLPGFVVNVSAGAQCLLAFMNGRPDQPFVCGWMTDDNASLISVEFMKNGLSAPLARVGDPVMALFPFTPVFSSPTPFPLTAVIQAGNPALLG